MPLDRAAALPDHLAWPGRPGPADLAALPGCAAVFLLVDEGERPIQLLTTQNLRRWMLARLAAPGDEPSKKTDVAAITRGVYWRAVACPFDARLWFYRLARALYPERYRELLAFGPAYYLHVDWSGPIAEIRVTEKIWRGGGEFIGPWPNHRSCQQALEQLWDLFDLCRYPEQVRRAPAGQRCAYAEMGRCDAPCDGSAPLAPYVERCRAAWRFAGGGVAAWIVDAESRMRAAASTLRFESASLLKQQIATAQSWLKHAAPTIRREAEMRFVLGLPVTRRKAWKVWRFDRGELIDGPIITQRKLAAGLADWLPLSRTAPPAVDDTTRMEQSWLLAHLMQHRERDTAIMIDDLDDDTELCGAFAERAAAIKPRSAASTEDWGESDVSATPAEPSRN